MSQQLAIRYRDFWDVPRIFFTEFEGRLYLFDCPFDEDEGVEDFPDYYNVYLMRKLSESDYSERWTNHWQKAQCKLGEIPMSKVRFDTTLRESIDSEILDSLTRSPMNASSNGIAHAPSHQPVV